MSSLREQIALVSQHVTLFNDSMANNIAYGCFDVSREQIERLPNLLLLMNLLVVCRRAMIPGLVKMVFSYQVDNANV